MAYTKTTWVEGNPPGISASNLNKIEQGIYDAHQQKVSKSGDTMTGQLTITGNPGLKLTGGHEGLEFRGDSDYFGATADARIIRMIDTNGSGGNVDGGLVIEAHTPTDGTSVELLRIRNNEFKWRGNNIWHAGNLSPSTSATANTVAQRDSNGDLTARVVKPTQYLQLPVLSSDPSSPPNGAIWMRS